MIPRYTRKKMSKIWEPQNKFQIWLDIELFICEALAKKGKIPLSSLKKIKEKAKFDVDRIDQIEKDVKHDVIAFLTNVAENIGEDSRFVHKGVTSSDILDTALSVQLKQSCKLLKEELLLLIENLKIKAIKFKKLACIGRSHGVFAEPTTFGLKMLGKFCEFKRHYHRLLIAEKEISVCSISGAVGTYANIDPYIEDYVSKKIGLSTEDVSTQVIPRDRHASLFLTLGMIASSIENLSIEIRHLQRSEVREVEEFFSKDQKGSSAMPHKKNPVLSENLTGIARIIRSNCIPFMENIALWHERDISHSSVERTIGPDSMILCDFALNRMQNIIKDLVINKKMMTENLKKTNGLYNSQRVMLQLIQKNISREESYRIVQKVAMKSWKENKDFKSLLKKDKNVKSLLSNNEINKLFDLNHFFRNIDKIYKRVLG
ncbi:MAG: adenylosuccinate lyase [Pseudomonadota bacterium]|nr:adenylosuccinate lyase [Pseudomonadota bacterium]